MRSHTIRRGSMCSDAAMTLNAAHESMGQLQRICDVQHLPTPIALDLACRRFDHPASYPTWTVRSMYINEALRIPEDEADLWRVLREQFKYVRHILWELPVETREAALQNDFHEREDGSISRASMGVIRYRGTREELDQRDYYLALGRELLPYIQQALDEETLTPEFIQQWGKIMFCHGYIASYVFDDTDNLALTRAGMKRGEQRSKDAQRKWIAHIIFPLMESGMTRGRAEEEAVKYVNAALSNEDLRGGFSVEWFKPIVTRGYLATTYDAKHFAVKAMRRLFYEAADDIPPIPKIP